MHNLNILSLSTPAGIPVGQLWEITQGCCVGCKIGSVCAYNGRGWCWWVVLLGDDGRWCLVVELMVGRWALVVGC